MTAVIAICKCPHSQRPYGIRFEKEGINWKYTWAFSISEQAANKEQYDKTQIVGNLLEGNEYPGCPYCGSKGFFLCGGCGKLNCWNGKDKQVTCIWCGNFGKLTGEINSLNITGNI